MEIFLSEKARLILKELREEDYENTCKSAICDAMSIIVSMHEVHATSDREKSLLMCALNVLADYNHLIDELSKKK